MAESQTLEVIAPVIGNRYPLIITNAKDRNERKTEGIYIGRHQVITPIFLEIEKPEGYTFVARRQFNRFEFYCTREGSFKPSQKLNENPSRIPVEKVNYSPTPNEIRSLDEFLDREGRK